MAAQAPAERLLIEGTLSGLRFVRNQMGQYADHVDFIAPGADGGRSGEGRITAWTWNHCRGRCSPCSRCAGRRGR
jgi:hypothetical protein